MKSPFFAFVFTLALLVAPRLVAQQPARDLDSILVEQRIKRMNTVLTLTDEQKTRLRPLISDEIKAFKSYRENTALTEEQRIAKEKEFRAAVKPKFKAILSEEQFTKYEQLQSGKGAAKQPAK